MKSVLAINSQRPKSAQGAVTQRSWCAMVRLHTSDLGGAQFVSGAWELSLGCMFALATQSTASTLKNLGRPSSCPEQMNASKVP